MASSKHGCSMAEYYSHDWLKCISGLDDGSGSGGAELCMAARVNQLPAAAAVPLDRRLRPQHDQPLRCPRCDSTHTKFCYYNNYSLSQPRYFCKACRRYWTKGGSLRNVPVGGGCRKKKPADTGAKKAAASTAPPPHVPASLNLSFLLPQTTPAAGDALLGMEFSRWKHCSASADAAVGMRFWGPPVPPGLQVVEALQTMAGGSTSGAGRNATGETPEGLILPLEWPSSCDGEGGGHGVDGCSGGLGLWGGVVGSHGHGPPSSSAAIQD